MSLLVSYYAAVDQRDYMAEVKQQLKSQIGEVQKMQKQVQDLEKTLDAPLRRLERLARIGMDRGRLLNVHHRIVNLKHPETSKLVFGPENKVYLTNLYISRDPFKVNKHALEDNEFSNKREEILQNSANLSGPKSFYAPLKKVSDLSAMPPELQPDLPLVVVLSGECPQSNNINTIRDIKKALEALDEVSGEVRTDDRRDGFVHKECVPSYDWLGTAFEEEEKQLHQPPMDVLYTGFHISFQWKLKDDIDPAAVAAAQEAKRKEAEKKAGPRRRAPRRKG